MFSGEVERDRWLTRAEADPLIAYCLPHTAAVVRYALATGCRASEITGLEWEQVDLAQYRLAQPNQERDGVEVAHLAVHRISGQVLDAAGLGNVVSGRRQMLPSERRGWPGPLLWHAENQARKRH